MIDVPDGKLRGAALPSHLWGGETPMFGLGQLVSLVDWRRRGLRSPRFLSNLVCSQIEHLQG